MNRSDLRIGSEFRTPGGVWRVTDIGTRIVAAIRIDNRQEDASWLNGPPYPVVEIVFDEYDLPGCEKIK